MVHQIRFGASLLVLLVATPALAQDAPEPEPDAEGVDVRVGRLERLTRGQRAPSDGFLVDPELLFDWSFEIRRLRRLRELDARAAERGCAVDLEHAGRRVQIEVERGNALEDIWRERAQGLAEELQEERGFDLLRSPAFWFVVGVLVSAAGAVGFGVAFRSP